VPTPRLELETVAAPALSDEVPREVLPSKNETVPVGTLLPTVEATVTARVTAAPYWLGFADDDRDVAVGTEVMDSTN
jgi:hypothetical protein